MRRVKYHNVTSVVWESQPQARPQNSQWASTVAPAQPQAQKAASDADTIIGATITDETRGKPRERKDAAVVALQELLQKHDMPMTRAQWRLWMSEHDGDFRELMKTAPTERKGQSRRKCARADLPKPLSRLQPQAQVYKPEVPWALVLWLRDG